MKDPVTKKDRRNHERFQVKSNIFVAIGRDRPIMGQLINISMRGMAMTYIADKNNGRRFDAVAQLGEEDSALRDIPFVTVQDTPMTVPDPYSSIEIRKHAGTFGTLSASQSTRLQTFIRQHAEYVTEQNEIKQPPAC